LGLAPTDMFIGHHGRIGTSMATGCWCRNDALALPGQVKAEPAASGG
jgi:hypothetical protein